MDKNLIVKLLRDASAPSAEVVHEVIKLKSQYPYSQVLHALSAKLTRDFSLPEQNQELQTAAVYASDRAVLKDVMAGALASEPVAVTTGTVTTETTPERESNDHIQEVNTTIDSVDLADTVISDLQKLSESKHNFEMLFADHSMVSLPVSSQSTDTKSKKERIVELAKSLNTDKDTTQESPPPVTKRKRKEHPGEEFIEQLKTKEELAPGNEKQKEQIQIIEHFIKKQPTIVNNRDAEPEALPDLTTIKTGEFSENIISETLVEILVKQGKKDRAIEVLKKLIWKYPQKKAYFASQIEELKK